LLEIEGMGHDLLEQGKVFSVNFLGKKSGATAEYFFTPPEPENGRLGSMPYTTDVTGAPILEDAIAYLECEVLRMIDEHSDHLLYVGKVVNAEVRSDEPPLVLSDTTWHYGG
jgi:flavin reductase (DIM6/NTAB) family NADH-FMN oxidoreductase RutF